jgi:hypothetical protein
MTNRCKAASAASVASLFLLAFANGASAQCTNGPAAVLTAQYDNSRDSVNSNETCLTPSSSTFYGSNGTTPIFIQQAAFPTLLSSGTESPIFGQPLYEQNVPIGGGSHNVVYVTALNDEVYAYDADNYGSGSPPSGVLYWSKSLVGNCSETVNGTTYPGTLVKLQPGPGVFFAYFGIVSTPVIDPAAGVLYVVNACSVTGPTNKGMQWFLNALDLGTGANAAPPVMIAGGVTNSSGSTAFVSHYELQRAALLLTENSTGATEVYIAFGAGTVEGADQNPYHGWLFGYTLSGGTLVQQSAFTTTPTAAVYSSMCNPVISDGYPLPPNWCGEAGGIWMSGRGPASGTVDGTLDIFLAVSNGGFQTAQPVNWGESVLKFPAGAATTPTDEFTPSGWYVDENENDEDMGTSGVLLFNGLVNGANRPYLVVLDKAGNLFLLLQNELGGFNSPDHSIQEFLATSVNACQQTNVAERLCNEPHSLVYWNDRLYMWPMYSPVRAFQFSNGTFMQPALEGGSAQGYPGGILALSSNGTSNGILWALNSLTTTQNERGPGNLTAFDAATLSMLWTSTDSMLLSTFAEPTVINGRVYVPTWNQGLLVYANH